MEDLDRKLQGFNEIESIIRFKKLLHPDHSIEIHEKEHISADIDKIINFLNNWRHTGILNIVDSLSYSSSEYKVTKEDMKTCFSFYAMKILFEFLDQFSEIIEWANAKMQLNFKKPLKFKIWNTNNDFKKSISPKFD